MRSRLIYSIAALAAVSITMGAAFAASGLATRTSSSSAVMVKATPRPFTGNVWEFEIAFDTHSRSLDDNLEKSAVLVVDGGRSYPPIKWHGDPPGGHHRKGVLQFKPVSPAPSKIELRIAREGETKPRVFEWSLK